MKTFKPIIAPRSSDPTTPVNRSILLNDDSLGFTPHVINFGNHVSKAVVSEDIDFETTKDGVVIVDEMIEEPSKHLEVLTATLRHIGLPHKCWKMVDDLRQAKIRLTKNRWESWCYLPAYYWMTDLFGHNQSLQSVILDKSKYDNIEMALKYTSGRNGYDALMRYFNTVIGVGTWRVTKHVYELDEVFYEHLVNTDLDPTRPVPSEILTRLPDWCVYVKFPDNRIFRTLESPPEKSIPDDDRRGYVAKRITGDVEMTADGLARDPFYQAKVPVRGFFAFIDNWIGIDPDSDFVKARRIMFGSDKIADSSKCLTILVDDGRWYSLHDTDDRTNKTLGDRMPLFEIISIPLGDWSIQDALLPSVCWLHDSPPDAVSTDVLISQALDGIAPFLNALLYICDVNNDIRNQKSGKTIEEYRKNKIKRPAGFLPGNTTTWDVGKRVGSILSNGEKLIRQAEEAASRLADTDTPSRLIPRIPHWRRAHWHLYWTGKGRTVPKHNWIQPVLVNADIGDVDRLPVVEREVKNEKVAELA